LFYLDQRRQATFVVTDLNAGNKRVMLQKVCAIIVYFVYRDITVKTDASGGVDD